MIWLRFNSKSKQHRYTYNYWETINVWVEARHRPLGAVQGAGYLVLHESRYYGDEFADWLHDSVRHQSAGNTLDTYQSFPIELYIANYHNADHAADSAYIARMTGEVRVLKITHLPIFRSIEEAQASATSNP